nr:hypothetical protein [Tanacetum cinerariifolium]
MVARGPNHEKGKNKLAYASKPKIPPPTKREDPAKDSICHECGETGHWKMNCSQYLAELLKKKKNKLRKLDGLLNSTDLRAFEKCVSCMSGKMARKPYTLHVERAKDLLGLIHTDVYLLKHKHEVFETFKVFQKKVENQLGKTIKSQRSDRGGEYMSQKFLDHLKDHGIIALRTPPYTPQHNGVSERRNKTLLDMVRSMMSQTTLPKSFWDYALETAARILNMVPTKKVKKTPYEEHELGDLGEPANYKAVLLDPKSKKWLIAMNVEMQSIKDNEVWVLVKLPPNGETIGSKWLFKKKTDMDGVVHTYKARLMAKG